MAGKTRSGRAVGLVAAVLCAGAAAAPLNDLVSDDRVSALRAELERALGGRWRQERYGVLALSLETGDTLYAHGAHEALAPASNLKLLTAAAALRYLGPEYRYRTFLLASGPIEAGRLRGDLILYGTGDPGLSYRSPGDRAASLEAFADSLAAAGVGVVEGDVVGDGSLFTGPLLAEGWDTADLNDWFAAPASSLSFSENVVTLRLVPTGLGNPPDVITQPAGAGIPVRFMTSTRRAGRRLLIHRTDPSQPITVEGSQPRGWRDTWRQITVSDPSRYAASVFRHVLESRGIRVLGEVRSVTDASSSTVTARRLWAPAIRSDRAVPRVIASHRSPPLLDYLVIVNKESHNLFADLALKTLGRVVAGEGSYAGGSRVLRRFLAEEVGADTAGLRVVDGSGLSALNRVSAATFVDVLAHMARTPLWDSYWSTLPEAGNPRELRRMYRTPAASNLRAKTGTIARVSALSGVVSSANGERILFSILANDVRSTNGAKRLEDRIGARLASFERPFMPAPPGPGRDAADTRPESGTTTGAPAAEQSHTVARGENLSVIAHRYAIGLDALVQANPGVTPRRLLPGARLRIPVPAPGTGPAAAAPGSDIRTHRVRPGDSFWTIARAYGVSPSDLVGANPAADPRTIRPGQTVRIPAASDR